jgi:hypothetical protein
MGEPEMPWASASTTNSDLSALDLRAFAARCEAEVASWSSEESASRKAA